MAALSAVAIALMSSAAIGSAAVSYRAAMLVVPGAGARGTRVSLTGTGLPSHRRATVFLGRRRLGGFRVGGHGHWSVWVRIPSREPFGSPRLRVLVGRAQILAAGFPVTATGATVSTATSLAVLSNGELVRLSPTRAEGGAFLSLQAAGFGRHAVVGVWLGGTRLSTPRASGHGTLRVYVRLPSATRAGRYVLSVRSRGRRLDLRVTVTPGAAVTPPGPGAPGSTVVVDAAGDLACSPTDPNFNFGFGVPGAVYPHDNCVQGAVSDLVANPLPTAFLTLGDNQYGTANGNNNGSLAQYAQVFGPTFGRANSVVYPEVGDGDYGDNPPPNSSGFSQYFTDTGVFSRIEGDGGNNANLLSEFYYSFNLGSWHIIALNSQCAAIIGVGGHGGCGVGSDEEKWLKADLAAHPGMCTLAYWHVPRWNSGGLGNRGDGAAFWTDLYNAHADIVLNAHGNNHYERFVPLNPAGAPDVNGIREFIVSNGGFSHGKPQVTGDQTISAVADYTSFGILQLTLRPGSYSWQFLPAAGYTFTDSGTGTCHQ